MQFVQSEKRYNMSASCGISLNLEQISRFFMSSGSSMERIWAIHFEFISLADGMVHLYGKGRISPLSMTIISVDQS